MKKITKEVFIILAVSLILGFIANSISSKGVPLIRDDSERFAIDSSKGNKSDIKTQRGKLNKAGFFQPVNITTEAAKQLFDEGVIFVDGRTSEEFKSGHIKDALNIDYITFKNKTIEEKKEIMKNIKKEQLIVSYCGSDSCEISIDNAYEMAKAGYDDVKIYLGGYKEWNKQGYPVIK